MDNSKPKLKRVVLFVPESDHRMLKSILALDGLNISLWVRAIIRNFLKEHENTTTKDKTK